MELIKLKSNQKLEDKVEHICSYCGKYADILYQFSPPDNKELRIHYAICVRCYTINGRKEFVEAAIHRQFLNPVIN